MADSLVFRHTATAVYLAEHHNRSYNSENTGGTGAAIITMLNRLLAQSCKQNANRFALNTCLVSAVVTYRLIALF